MLAALVGEAVANLDRVDRAEDVVLTVTLDRVDFAERVRRGTSFPRYRSLSDRTFSLTNSWPTSFGSRLLRATQPGLPSGF
jgi:hypothetical protein